MSTIYLFFFIFSTEFLFIYFEEKAAKKILCSTTPIHFCFIYSFNPRTRKGCDIPEITYF